MKKQLLVLVLLTIGLLNLAKAANKHSKVTSRVENKLKLGKNKIAKLQNKKYASLCGFSFWVNTQCADGSIEPVAIVNIAYWCDTGVINVNMSYVVSSPPSVGCIALTV